MMNVVGRLVLVCSLAFAVACEDSKDGKKGESQGITVPGANTSAENKAQPKPVEGKAGVGQGTPGTPGSLGTLGATPPTAAGTVPGANPVATADQLAKQAAGLANEAATKAGGTLGNLPSMGGPAAGKKTVTKAEGLARLRAIQATSCACRDRACATRALTAFGVLYNDIKHMPADQATYADVKTRSAEITKCLMRNGITGQEVMNTFTGGAKVPSAPAAPAGSASSLAGQLEQMATETCGCADKACATRYLGKFAAYFAMNKNVPTAAGDYKRIQTASAKLAACLVQKGIAPKDVQAIVQ